LTSRFSYRYSWLLLLPVAVAFLWFGTRDRQDPLWIRSGLLLEENTTLISDVPDSLQWLYCQIHKVRFIPGDTAGLHLVNQPAPANIEWRAFRKLTMTAFGSQRTVISGVTGTGATKQAKRAANLIAGSTERVLSIDCAPGFDMEYHKKYIGSEDEQGRLIPGELLEFWEKCRRHPERRFVAVVDNFDKINPETFFGATLWEALSSRKVEMETDGIRYTMPENFHLISVTHLGPGSKTEFNEEHFKRLGSQYILEPNPRELIAVLDWQKKNGLLDSVKADALQQRAYKRAFVFYFIRINELLRDRFGDGFQMGQGTNLRSYYHPDDRGKLKQTVISHLNALKPDKQLRMSDFDDIEYTIDENGLMPRTSFLAQQLRLLKDTGYLVEITMVAATALLTAFVGYLVYRRRESLIRRYFEKVRQVFQKFEDQQISPEIAARRLVNIKEEVDDLVLKRKLGYTEGMYFMAFVEDKVKRVEFARNVSENFSELFGAFMEDGVLNESEYLKLRQFLQSIRHRIPAETYEQLNEKVEKACLPNRFRQENTE
jgi:hypothetical protein